MRSLFLGYSACERCDQKGESLRNRTIFPITDPAQFELRDNVSFRRRTDVDHHHAGADSPFVQIQNLDMVFGFPLDYLHLVLLGVMRKKLKIWVSGLATSPFSIDARGKRLINRRLRRIRKHLCSEFER